MIARIYLPHGIDRRVVLSIKRQAADKFGGFTVLTAEGGWVADNGDLIEEPVDIISVEGADEIWAKSTAQWAAKKSDETEIMWQTVESSSGFER